MDSARACARCGAREGAPLCPVCEAAGPVRWHASDWRTWLPAASACALLSVAAALATLTAVLLAVATARGHAPSLSSSWLRMAGQAWWTGLGAPCAVRLDAHGLGTFNGAFRLSAPALALPFAFFLVAGGAGLTRILGAAGEIEHLIAGAFLALPGGLVCGVFAALLPLTLGAVHLGDVTATLEVGASPLHAAAVGVLWSMISGAAGGLARYCWTTRAIAADRWAGLRRAPWPWLAGATSGALAALVLCTLVGLAALPGVGGLRPRNKAAPTERILREEAVVTFAAALATQPVALACLGVEGRVVAAEAVDDSGSVPTDARLRLGLGSVVAVDPSGTTQLALPRWPMMACIAALFVGALVGGAVAARLGTLSFLGLGLTYAVFVLAIAGWEGLWIAGQLQVGSSPVVLWGAWYGLLPRVGIGSLVIGLLGGVLGASLGRR